MKIKICLVSCILALTSMKAWAAHSPNFTSPKLTRTWSAHDRSTAKTPTANDEETAKLSVGNRITNVADLKNGETYLIRNLGESDRRGYLCEEGNKLRIARGDNYFYRDPAMLPYNFLFRITGNSSDGFSFSAISNPSVTSAQFQSGDFVLRPTPDGEEGVWTIYTPGGYMNVLWGELTLWGDPSSINGFWEIYPAEILSELVDITYNLYYGNTLLESTTLSAPAGESYPIMYPHTPYCLAADYPKGNAEAGTYNLQAVHNFPFAVSPSVEEAHWYAANMRDNTEYNVVFDGEASVVTRTMPLSAHTHNLDNYLWGFVPVADKFDHFKLLNKGANRYVVASTVSESPVTLGDETEATIFRFVENGNGFNLQVEDQVTANLNDIAGILGVWNHSQSIEDPGSRFTIHDPLTGTGFDYFFPNVRNDLAGGPTPNYVGAISGTYPESIRKAYEAYTNQTSVNEMAQGYSDYKNYSVLPRTTLDGRKIYRIKNYCRDLSRYPYAHLNNEGAYMAYAPAGSTAAIACHTQSHADVDALWILEGDAFSGYKLYNLNAQLYVGKTDAESNASYLGLTDETQAGTYAMKQTESKKLFTLTCSNVLGNAYKQLHAWGEGIINYGSETLVDAASYWHVEQVSNLECTLNTAGDGASYTTLYLPFAVEMPEGTKAYTLTEKDGDATTLIATEIDNGLVPAYTGVLLKNEIGETNILLRIETNTPAKLTTILKGTCIAQEVTNGSEHFVLGDGVNGIGFYPATDTTLPANKAYLHKTGGEAQAYTISFENLPTGIDGTPLDEPTAENAAYYDLSGRRVLHPTKGLYIHRGKKVYIP